MRRAWELIIAGAIAARLLDATACDPYAQSFAAEAVAAAPLPWAKPVKGGTLRVSAVFPQDGSADLTAFEADFDVRMSLFPIVDEMTTADKALTDALNEKADALLVSSVLFEQLSETTRATLATRISGGLGVLWIAYSTSGKPELQELLRAAGLTVLEPAPDFVTRAGGAGLSGVQPGLDQTFAYASDKSRVIELRFWKPRPSGHALVPLAPVDVLEAPTTYENYLAIAGGALRWAAHRDPEAAIAVIEDRASTGPREQDTPPQLPAAFVKRMKEAALPGVLRPFAVKLDRPAPRNYGLRVRARYADQPIRWSYDAEEIIRKGAQETLVNIPIGAGASFLDVWIVDGLKVVDWFTQPLDLPAPPELGEVSFGSSAIDANDRLRVSADVHKDLLRGDAQRPQPATVYLRVTDALGRVVASRDLPVPNAGAQVKQELALVDLIGPYAHAELFAAPVSDTPLSWWIREHATYRAAHISVRQPLPEGLALIVDEAGEGSFAASALRRKWLSAGVDYIFPGVEPDLGNITADGLRVVARLGDQKDFPGDHLGARSRPGIALRQATARYAAGRPGLYVVSATESAPPMDAEKARAAIERVVRETDPRAAVALLDGDVSAAGTGGFLVLPADAAQLDPAAHSAAAFVAIHTQMPTGERATAQNRWLPWLAVIYRANALWISPEKSDDADTALADLFAAVGKVRDGYDVLLRKASLVASSENSELKVPKGFSGLVKRFELGGTTFFVFLADPAAESKAAIKVSTQGDKTRIYIPTAPIPTTALRSTSLKLQPGEGAVAALLPYEVARIALDVPASVAAGKRLVVRATVKTHGALPGDHVLRATCFGPMNKPLPHYSRTVFASAGSGATWIPIAFNDTPGTYRIVVRDALSGVSSEANFTVLASQESAAAAER